jgi:ribosomal protein S27AE
MSKLYRVFNKIDTVEGFCEECGEQTILVAIVSEFYRCTNCGHDTKQHINGRIRYLQLDESDKKWIKDNIKKWLNKNLHTLYLEQSLGSVQADIKKD